jgi:hypothetical protein
MAGNAPPVADTKKPATPPPAAKNGPQAGAGGAAPTAGQAAAGTQGAKPAYKAPGKAAPSGGGTAANALQTFNRLAMRPKLEVSEPGDAVEREADAVADKVMRMPDPQAASAGAGAKPADKAGGKGAANAGTAPKAPAPTSPGKASASGAQPKGGGAQPAIQREAKPGHDQRSQRQDTPSGAGQPDSPAALKAQLGAGMPLDQASRAFFEQRLGRDLSEVRIHTDAKAADAASSLHARAFAYGNHIVFAGGAYQPGSDEGKRLLAHELAHVMQNDNLQLGHVVHRAVGGNAAEYTKADNIANDAIDPTLDAAARPALETLKLPTIKARHAPEYQARAGKSLIRPKGYDRDKPAFATDQIAKWKAKVDLTAHYASIGFDPSKGRQSLTHYGDPGRPIEGTPGEIANQLKIPQWSPDGSFSKKGMQVDHIVERQVGGDDEFANFELLSGEHNEYAGSLMGSSIRKGVRTYLDAVKKNPGKASDYLRDNDINFQTVEGGASGSSTTATEGKSGFWSRDDIAAGKHLTWLKDEKRPAKDEGTDKTRFALYSDTGNGFITAFPLSGNTVSVGGSQQLSGIKITAIDITTDLSKPGTGSVGTLTGDWVLPQDVRKKDEKGLSITLNRIVGKQYAGALASFTPPDVDVKGASPVKFDKVNFVRGQVQANGTLTASHELFAGVQIPVRWRGEDFAFEYTLTAGDLKDKLKLPGIEVEEATVMLSYGTQGLGAEGSIDFGIKGFGSGNVTVGMQTGKESPVLYAKGSLTVDRKLFDLAQVEIGYKTGEGFNGKGTIGITDPKKIKGIKSAKLTVSYANSVFAAEGDVQPDVPGLKSAGLKLTYADEKMAITGQLGLDDKVPCVESANITVNVAQAGEGWKVGASGTVTPKLPGLKGALLTFSYDDGAVLLEGSFNIDKGPLSGTVKAGVTNATVNDKGERSEKGEGSNFSVFGAADIDAVFIPDKLKGKLKLRLLPDGSLRVGGGLTVPDFQIFPRIPQGNPNFLSTSVTTPKVPIPGLGFSVGPVSVGVTMSATLGFDAFAYVGPGMLRGITVTVKEFNPADVDIDTLEIGGGATFEVPGDAGAAVSASLNLNFSAAVAELEGSVGLKAQVGIPPEQQPILKAKSDFTYSNKAGLDIQNTLSLSINPALKFSLFGKVAAKLNLLVSTVTVWSKDWTLAEASYKLPVSINAKGQLGYNSKTNKLTPDSPADMFKVQQPAFDADTIQAIAMDKPAPPQVATTTPQGKPISPQKVMSMEPNQSVMPNASSMDDEPNRSVMPAREPGVSAGEGQRAKDQTVDEGVIKNLGSGQALDANTRGFFEQSLKADLSGVRIHTTPEAQDEAEKLSARAFTVGQDIVFAKGEYQPDKPEGRELLAHELAHVQQQQGGAARAVMRETGDETHDDAAHDDHPATPAADASATPGTGAGTATTTPAAGSTDASAAPGGATAASPTTDEDNPTTPPATIDLGQLKLPQFKANVQHRQDLYQAKVGANALYRPASFNRGDTAQSATWMSRVSAAGALGRINTRLGSAVQPNQPYLVIPKRARTRGIVVGTPTEIADAVKRPLWNRDGQFQTFHVDHIVELQVNGEDHIDNMELLAAGPNQASGRDIRSHLETDITTWKTAHPTETRTVPRIKRYYRINFSSVTGAYAPAEADYWRKTEIDQGAQLDFDNTVNILDPQAPRRGAPFSNWPAGLNPRDFTGSPTRVVLYPRQSGGMPHGIDWPADQEGNTRAVDIRDWIQGFHITSVQFNTAGTDPNAGMLRGTLFSGNPRLAFDGVRVEVPIERKSGMPYAGFINKSYIQRQITSIFNQEGVAGASPVTIQGFDIEDDKGAVLRGRIQPSLGIIRNSAIDLVIEGDDLRAEKTFTGGELNLGGPFRVTNSDLTVSIGTRSGFRVLGGAAFEIQRLGQGRLEGQAGSREGFRVAGDFQFDRRLFDADASIRLAYARGPDAPDGKLSGGGTISIGAGRVRGIRSATVDANFDGETRSIQGSAELDIPGVESASLGVQFTPEGGTTISGSARFRDRPGMRNGHIEATLSEGTEGWSLNASGGAEATFAGLTAQLEASYRNGLFMFAADAPYSVGDRVSGHVCLGLTNGQVDDQGRLLDTPPTPGTDGGGELRPFGNGTVNVRITDWLQGGVGLRVQPSGDILISGRIGIPQPVTVFDQYPSPERARRTLFQMPTVSVPLVGIAVGGNTVGLALTINGRINGHAQVGPGRLTQTELVVEDFNPAQPESLHVTGGATFDLPAQAGVEASLDAGVSLGAALIRATAGINVSAEAGVEAHVTPHVDVDWRPSAGLHLHADMNASLSPRLAFNVNGYAEVVADAFVTSFTLWRKDWNLARREIGSNLGLNLAVPVDYYSDGRGVVFDPNAVRFDVPTLNADTLGQLMNNEGGSERAQRGEGH